MADMRVLGALSRMLDLMDRHECLQGRKLGMMPTPRSTEPALTQENATITNPVVDAFREWFDQHSMSDSSIAYEIENTTHRDVNALSIELGIQKDICYKFTVARDNTLIMRDGKTNEIIARGEQAIKRYLIERDICRE